MIEIINVIPIVFVAILLGALIIYLFLRPRLRRIRVDNEEREQRLKELEDTIAHLNYDICTLQITKDSISQSIDEWENHLSRLKAQAETTAQTLFEQSMSIMQEKFAMAAEDERKKYLTTIEDYKKQLATAMEEGASSYVKEIAEYEKNFNAISEQFDELKATTDAAVAAAKRAEEIKQEAKFYKIQLSDLDIEEIHMLRNITPYLRDKEPLNKAIWKTYYEKPTIDLINRVVGANVRTGIYKITNLDNNKCYVGQSVNISDRWKQHIKRGLGAEAPTRNKLYPAMIAFGVENFSFEVIEDCPKEKLDEREDYWQDYFKAKEFGYSIK